MHPEAQEAQRKTTVQAAQKEGLEKNHTGTGTPARIVLHRRLNRFLKWNLAPVVVAVGLSILMGLAEPLLEERAVKKMEPTAETLATTVMG